MKILIASDKFKGACTALEVGEYLKKGIESVYSEAECSIIPLADGGEGTLDALAVSLNAEWRKVETQDPLGRPINAAYLFVPQSNTAIIEMSRASGFELLSDSERNCMLSSSYGTGVQMLDAIKSGIKEIVLTVGGSATNDAAIGIATALGFRFLDKLGNNLEPIGKSLSEIRSIDSSDSIFKSSDCRILIATDVENPFFGEKGAAKVFARQKGATSEEIEILDQGLRNFNQVLINEGFPSVEIVKGSGAGGGVGGGLYALLGAEIFSAADWVLKVNNIEQALEKADILITGEGKIDSQTWDGKLISRLLKKASIRQKPVVIICGTLEDIDEIPLESTICHISSIIHRPISLMEAINQTPQLLEKHGQLLGHYFKKNNFW